MRKLYLRIYLAVLASLIVFALVSGLLWRQLGNAGPAEHAVEVAGTLAQNVLPPAWAPKSEQQAALLRLAANLEADVALFAADREESMGTVLRKLEIPLLFVQHEGCLLYTSEGFEDVAAEFGDATTASVQVKPSANPEFAEILREFCEGLAEGADAPAAGQTS